MKNIVLDGRKWLELIVKEFTKSKTIISTEKY